MTRTFHRLAFLATAALLAALIAVPAQAGGSDWRTRAEEALAAWHQIDDVTPATGPLSIAAAGLATATLYGWDDPDVPKLVDRVMELRNPDGGWGLNAAWDAFGDGTTNPASTSYTVTMADHVGPFLLGAYQHGLITSQPLTDMAQLIIGLPRWSVDGGSCVPYSMSTNDRPNSGYCVHNVNAAAGLFLGELFAAGVPMSGSTTLRMMITIAEVNAYSLSSKNWPYQQSKPTVMQDQDHNALSSEWALTEAPGLGYFPQVNIMLNSFPSDPNSPLAHFRLAYSRCSSADQWLPEFDQWLTGPASPAIDRYAQMARYAARTAVTCGG